MVSKVGNSLLLRSGVVIVAILAVTGFATGIIPVRCLVGKACAPRRAGGGPRRDRCRSDGASERYPAARQRPARRQGNGGQQRGGADDCGRPRAAQTDLTSNDVIVIDLRAAAGGTAEARARCRFGAPEIADHGLIGADRRTAISRPAKCGR